MPGPWDKYQSAQPTGTPAGPWQKYSAGPSQAQLDMNRVQNASPTQFEMSGGAMPGESATSPIPENGVIDKATNFLRGAAGSLTSAILHPIETTKGMGSGQMAGGMTPYGAPMIAPTGNQARDTANQQAMQSNQQDVLQGADAALKQSTSHVVGSFVGPALLGEAATRMHAPAAPPEPAPVGEAPLPRGSLTQRAVRGSLGLGEGPMAKTANAALTDHAETVGKVMEANSQTAADYARKVAKVEGMNTAGQEQVAKRAAIDSQVMADSAELAHRVQVKAQAVRAQGKAMYDQVSQAVNDKLGPDAGAPAPEVAKLVKHAEDNILVGSRPEAIKQFRLMLEEAKQTGGPNAAIIDQTAQGLGYDSAADAIQRIGPEQFNRYLPQELQGVSAEPAIIPFRDLGGYVTELGDMMYNRGVPNDVFSALRYVRDGMQGMRQQLASDAGVGQALIDANQYWARYEQTYNNARSTSFATKGLGPERIGSPIAKLVRAVDPPTIRSVVTGNASERLIKNLTAEDPELGALAQRIRDGHAQVGNLPKRYVPKPAPEAPEPKPIPETPNLQQVAEDARLKRLDSQISALRSPRAFAYEIPLLIGSLWKHGLGGVVLGEFATRQALAKIFESPKVVDWLTSATPRDMEILNRLDPHQKAPVQMAITQKLIDTKTPASQAMRQFLLPNQVRAIAAATISTGAARTYHTPHDIMLAMKTGDLDPTEGTKLLQQMRGAGARTRRLSQSSEAPTN
jgi:hypothetical protein